MRSAASTLEVAQGVYRLGTRWANFYLVVDDGEALLVDAGYPGYFGHLQARADEIGVGLHGVRAVIVTHHHVDHTGTAEAVRSRTGAAVFVGAGDATRYAGSGLRARLRASGARAGGRAWRAIFSTAPALGEPGTGRSRS